MDLAAGFRREEVDHMARRSASKPQGQNPARLYDLPLWATDAEQFPDEGIRGQGWRAGAKNISVPHLADEGFEAHVLSMRERYPKYSVNFIYDPSSENKSRAAPQIYIEARSRIAAQALLI
jgi:hypothetical protein